MSTFKVVGTDIQTTESRIAESAIKTLAQVTAQVERGEVIEVIVCCIHADGAFHTEMSGQRDPVKMTGALEMAKFQALMMSAETE